MRKFLIFLTLLVGCSSSELRLDTTSKESFKASNQAIEDSLEGVEKLQYTLAIVNIVLTADSPESAKEIMSRLDGMSAGEVIAESQE